MKFKIQKKELQNALNAEATVAMSGTDFIGGALLVEAKEDKLVFTGSSGGTTIWHETSNGNYECLEEGVVCVPGKTFNDSVKTMPDDVITIGLADNQVVLNAKKSRLKISPLQADDFPRVMKLESKATVVFQQKELKDVIDKTVFAVSNQPSRPILQGVNFNLKSGTLTCVATDSFRLTKTEALKPFESEVSVVVPGETLKTAKKLMNKDDEAEVVLEVSEKGVVFKLGDTTIQTSLYSGNYPETDRLIPSEFKYTLKGNREYLKEVFGRAGFIRAENNVSVVKLEMSENGCSVSKRDYKSGSDYREDLEDVVFEGPEALSISMCSNYVEDALNALDDDEVTISFVGNMKPVIITGESKETLELVLPVRTYD